MRSELQDAARCGAYPSCDCESFEVCVPNLETHVKALLEERELLRQFVVRSQLVAEQVGCVPNTPGLERALKYLKDVQRYLAEVANAQE
jgi:hypothetical protein